MSGLCGGAMGRAAREAAVAVTMCPCASVTRLLLQIAAEAPGEVEATSMTFGATLKGCRALLECAQELGMQVVGVK